MNRYLQLLASWKNHGEAPCPMPGRENGLIFTDHNGQPAKWYRGHVYTPPAGTQPIGKKTADNVKEFTK